MRILTWLGMLAMVSAAFGYGQPGAQPAISDAGARAEGLVLARDLQMQRPETNTVISGWLTIQTNRSQRVRVPLRFQISLTSSDWQSSYFTTGSNRDHEASLVVVHIPGQPNQYTLSQSNLTVEQAIAPFAGSDFWLADLGLEFFHWPDQRLVKKEIRRGRACRVLESVSAHPATNGYSRVVSWIDRETSGIVYAEAYDAQGKLLKEFSPKEFKKVNGQWQLQEMEMRNVQTRSRSQIEFEVTTGP